MVARPSALGLEVEVKSIDDVDPILHELAWINNEAAKLDAQAREKIDAIMKDFEPKYSVEIAGQVVPFKDRYEYLEGLLAKWLPKHLKKHLVGKKKSRDLPHGTVGLRQQPMVVQLQEDVTEVAALDKIDIEADGIVARIREWATKKLKSLGCLVNDVLTIKVSINEAGVRKAFEEKRLTAEQVESFGLEIREAEDKGTIKPNALIVSE